MTRSWALRARAHAPRLPATASGQIRLFHDTQKLLLVYFSITVAVGLIDHLLKLLVCHTFAKLLCNAFQILERDLACLIVIEQTERLQNLVLGVTVQDLVSHHF